MPVTPTPRLLLTGRDGDALTTEAPSASSAGTWWHQRIPLPAGPIACTCRGYRRWGRCSHQAAGEELRAEYLTVREVQAGLSTRTLRQTAEATHPENIGHPFPGVVTITFLAAMATLEERRAARAEMAA